MKLLVDQYMAYDRWANTRFVERLLQEPAEVLDAHVPSSFPSLRTTMLHVRDAGHVWLCRLSGAPHRWPAQDDTSLHTVMPHLQRLHDHVCGLDEEGLLAEHAYADLKGNVHRQPAWQMIMHCINHGTQHRGQLITMMRALGLAEIPANDLVVFQRSAAARG